MPWILVVVEGNRRSRLPIEDPGGVAGSGANADFRIDHPTVSRRHAKLQPGPEGLWVTDLGSSNGTRADGVALRDGALVSPGQLLHLGSVECRIEATDAGEIEPALLFSSDETPASAEAAATAVGTLTVGSVRDFVLSALPAIVERLEEQRTLRARVGAAPLPLTAGLEVVQAAGQALFNAFPCRALEILEHHEGDGPAVLFRAGEAPTDGAESSEEDWAQVRAGRLETRVRFVPDLHSGGILPLIALVTRLAALDFPAPLTARPPRERREGPPLPQPPTVDPVVRSLYEDARRIAAGDVGVIIHGESGTGKEVLAKFIHAASPRADGELVALNCAALPQDLLEAELFGIERGVATGVEARPGRFEQADGGTLFLDEIGDMAPATQAKILRVLQEGEVYRLGSRSPRKAQVRVITATHRDLPRMIEAGDFRLDLYHRIADCRFTLPPLRERLGDLPNLAAHFLVRAAEERDVQVRGISKAALAALLTFAWPGNVRQLEREMTRAALFLEDGELLQTRHLHGEIAGDAADRSSGGESRALKSRLESYERGVILEELVRNDRNVRQTATELGVGRTTLYRRIQELGIEI